MIHIVYHVSLRAVIVYMLELNIPIPCRSKNLHILYCATSYPFYVFSLAPCVSTLDALRSLQWSRIIQVRRGKSLVSHKSLNVWVNKCWLKLWKFPLKCWEGQKKWLFSWGWQNGRRFLQSGVEILHMAFKMTLKDVFPPTLNHTIISWKMKKNDFLNFGHI